MESGQCEWLDKEAYNWPTDPSMPIMACVEMVGIQPARGRDDPTIKATVLARQCLVQKNQVGRPRRVVPNKSVGVYSA
jgi:hypothetical protein